MIALHCLIYHRYCNPQFTILSTMEILIADNLPAVVNSFQYHARSLTKTIKRVEHIRLCLFDITRAAPHEADLRLVPRCGNKLLAWQQCNDAIIIIRFRYTVQTDKAVKYCRTLFHLVSLNL